MLGGLFVPIGVELPADLLLQEFSEWIERLVYRDTSMNPILFMRFSSGATYC